jgi:hypothetical protein
VAEVFSVFDCHANMLMLRTVESYRFSLDIFIAIGIAIGIAIEI